MGVNNIIFLAPLVCLFRENSSHSELLDITSRNKTKPLGKKSSVLEAFIKCIHEQNSSHTGCNS